MKTTSHFDMSHPRGQNLAGWLQSTVSVESSNLNASTKRRKKKKKGINVLGTVE